MKTLLKTGLTTTLTGALTGAALLAAPAFAQDRRDIEVDAFHAIEAGGGMRVEVEHGDAPAVWLDGDAGDFEDVRVRVRNGRLDIGRDTGLFNFGSGPDVTVHVVATGLDSLDFGQGVSARVTGLDADDLEVEISTGSAARLDGRCTTLDVDVSTGGMLEASALICEDVEASASTGGSASLHASHSLSGRASMGGELDVHGGPEVHDLRMSMGGDIRIRDDS